MKDNFIMDTTKYNKDVVLPKAIPIYLVGDLALAPQLITTPITLSKITIVDIWNNGAQAITCIVASILLPSLVLLLIDPL